MPFIHLSFTTTSSLTPEIALPSFAACFGQTRRGLPFTSFMFYVVKKGEELKIKRKKRAVS